ncbi:MAG TPA: VOC family protein [Puia sp.]|nr:VOC family protein [Puia sp.]
MKKIFFLSAFILFSMILHAQKITTTFDHMGILVRDLDKSTAFYINVLGLDSIRNPWPGQRATWFKIGERYQLHLMEEKKDSLAIPAFNHLCFSVGSVNDFIAKLNKENIPYYDAQWKRNGITNMRADGVKQIFFRDPDGYVIEVNDRVH